MRAGRAGRAAAAVALLAACACSAGGGPDGPTSPPSPAAAPSAAPPPRVDRVPDAVPRLPSELPAELPPDDSLLPDLLADPPHRARLAYHPRESFDDPAAWEAERVLFLGLDGGWRALELGELGLDASTHPGADTYGAGELSPDGRAWAAPTTAGIVLLDVPEARWHVLRVPGDHTRYLRWHPDGGRIDVVRLHGASTQRTWTIDPRTYGVERAPYSLPVDGFAADGSVVTFGRRGPDTLRTVHGEGPRVTHAAAVPFRVARRGGAVGLQHTLFGLNRELVAVDHRTWAPAARLRLDRTMAAGWPRGWWDRDTIWFYVASRGLMTWNVRDGRTHLLTRVQPAARDDTYWSVSVAVDLMR